MKRMKSSLTIALVTMLMLSMLPSLAQAAQPDMSNAANACPLAFSQEYSGELNKAVSNNWYSFTLAKPGVVTVKFTQPYKAALRAIFVNLVKGTDQINSTIGILRKEYQAQFSTKAEWTPIGLGAGTYYVYLQPDAGSLMNMSGVTMPYTVQVDHVGADDWEQEPNFAQADATPVTLGKTMHGSTTFSTERQKSGDADWFKFDIPASGEYDFSFATPDFEIDRGLKVQVMGGKDFEEFDTLHLSDKDAVRLSLSSGAHYMSLNMRGVHSNRYNFTITQVKRQGSLSGATKAQLAYTLADKAYTGKAQGVSVKPKTGVGKVTAVYYNKSKTRPKAIGAYKVTVDVAAGTDYKAVKGLALGTLKIVPGKTAVSKIAVGKKQLKVTWKKVAAAQRITRYEVRCRAKGAAKWTTRSFAASASFASIAKLTKGKVYQVQIRSYKTVSGKKYYSAWSATKTSAKIK